VIYLPEAVEDFGSEAHFGSGARHGTGTIEGVDERPEEASLWIYQATANLMEARKRRPQQGLHPQAALTIIFSTFSREMHRFPSRGRSVGPLRPINSVRHVVEIACGRQHGYMGAQERIYRGTDAGLQAQTSEKSALSFLHRRILGLIHGDTHFTVIRAGMGTCRENQVADWLQQLETLGFVTSHSVGGECDLDFTSSMSLATLAARHKAG
jgi:hypothetical protein